MVIESVFRPSVLRIVHTSVLTDPSCSPGNDFLPARSQLTLCDFHGIRDRGKLAARKGKC